MQYSRTHTTHTYGYVWPCQRIAVGTIRIAYIYVQHLYIDTQLSYTNIDMFGPANASQLDQSVLHIYTQDSYIDM